MPEYLLRPIAHGHKRITFEVVHAIGEIFDTSRTATAIRLVEGTYFTGYLVCHSPKERKWFTRSPDVPERWFPRQDLAHDSFAFDVLFAGAPEGKFPRRIGAEAWVRPLGGRTLRST